MVRSLVGAGVGTLLVVTRGHSVLDADKMGGMIKKGLKRQP
jgi:hypothetical protein